MDKLIDMYIYFTIVGAVLVPLGGLLSAMITKAYIRRGGRLDD